MKRFSAPRARRITAEGMPQNLPPHPYQRQSVILELMVFVVLISNCKVANVEAVTNAPVEHAYKHEVYR